MPLATTARAGDLGMADRTILKLEREALQMLGQRRELHALEPAA
jgi:hypothetical protein